MNFQDRVDNHFARSQQALSDSQGVLNNKINDASVMIVHTLQSRGKLLVCGNGGSAADALHFTAELLNRFVIERAPLAAIALNADVSTLTAIANDFAFEYIFSKQVEALGSKKDLLIVFTTSGNSANIKQAIKAAHNMGMAVIALTGKTGGDVPALLQSDDMELRVPNNETARIQEVHGLVVHCLCDLIDQRLFGENL